MKRIVIHQPDFLPHLAFFHRLLDVDLFIVLDHVQFVNGSSRAWTHRDKIKTPKGEKWLTVSTKKVPRNTAINQVFLADNNWRADNLNLIKEHYSSAKGFNEVFPYIKSLYEKPCVRLSEFNMLSIQMLLELFDIQIMIKYSSDMNPQENKNELLINLLKKVNATHYLSGTGARDYLNESLFKQHNINVEWQNFDHPVYVQKYDNFIPYLSSIDMLLNCGINKSRKLLRNLL